MLFLNISLTHESQHALDLPFNSGSCNFPGLPCDMTEVLTFPRSAHHFTLKLQILDLPVLQPVYIVTCVTEMEIYVLHFLPVQNSEIVYLTLRCSDPSCLPLFQHVIFNLSVVWNHFCIVLHLPASSLANSFTSVLLH